jgi:hypothetical protein
MVLSTPVNQKDIHPTTNKGVQIYSLLAEGRSIQFTAKLLKCSVSLVWKHAKKYVKNEKLERLSVYPAQFRKTQTTYTHTHVVGDLHPAQPPIDIPCKFGASFAQVGQPPLIYNQGKAKDEQPTHIAIFGRHKTVIWLRAGFRGETPDEIIENGNETLKAIARGYEQQYGISLAYLTTFLDIEWIMVNLAAGKRISKYEGIKNGERKVIANAWHKQGDSSHPRHRQYQAVPGEEKTKPTEHASLDHYIYSGQLASDIMALVERDKAHSDTDTKFAANLERHLGVLEKMETRLDKMNEIDRAREERDKELLSALKTIIQKGLAPKEESK